MPEWLKSTLTIAASFVFSVGGMAAIQRYMESRHRRQRQAKGDSVEVLQDVIGRLEAGQITLRTELEAHRQKVEADAQRCKEELGDLKDKYTASRLELERCKTEIRGARRELRQWRGGDESPDRPEGDGGGEGTCDR